MDKRDWNSIEKGNDFEEQYPQKNRLNFKKANGKVLCYGLKAKGWTVLRQTTYLGKK